MARAHLTWLGVIDDPLAQRFLRWPWTLLNRMLRRKPLSSAGRSRAFAYLAARTKFYDTCVEEALDHGVRQVVILAAGCDSRSWRLARPGVSFFEVDLPATQARKRDRAPEGGPVFVSLGEGGDPSHSLIAGGFDMAQPVIFTIEGLTMYLSHGEVTDLLSTLAAAAAPESRLAVDFGVGTDGAQATLVIRVLQATTVLFARLSSEPLRCLVEPDRVDQLLEASGWRVDEVLIGPALAQRFLLGTGMPSPRERPGAFVVAATRSSTPSSTK
jgi:methyltransferase (TIGR00027 family)